MDLMSAINLLSNGELENQKVSVFKGFRALISTFYLLPLDYGFVVSTLCSGIDGRMLSISWGFISTILFSGTFCGHFAVMRVKASSADL
jgi:hypothetical protein